MESGGNSEVYTAIVAIYAAVVATGALALEVRRWIESGPRLKLALISEARLYGGVVVDESDYLGVSVANSGDRPTTVTNLCFHEISNWFAKLRNRWSRAAVANDFTGSGVPFVLHPGTEWKALVQYNDELMSWAKSGRLFVAVYFSHTNRPLLRKIEIRNPTNPPPS
jgi:hypothetical protein